MADVMPWWEDGATTVHGHTATWTDGLRVSRLAKHRKQLWIEIEYGGAVHEVWLGPRTFRASRQKAKRRKRR